MFSRWWTLLLALAFSAVLAGVLVFVFVVVIVYPTLPSLEVLTDYRPKVPLRVFSSEGLLIGEFGEERRAVVTIGAVPKSMRDAILAAEDESPLVKVFAISPWADPLAAFTQYYGSLK